MTKALNKIPERPRIYTRDGELFASSIDVARYFKVSHRTVLDAIDRRMDDARRAEVEGDEGMLEGCLALYRKTSIPRQMPRGGTAYDDGFEMTETGVTLVGMSLTTPRARVFQMRYTAEFNRMRAELQVRQPADRSGFVDLNDLASVQVALLSLVQDKQRLLTVVSETKGQLAVAAPKAASWDAYANADGLIALSDIGRILDVGARKLVDFLLAQKILFRSGRGSPLRPIDVYRRKGWFRVITTPIDGIERMQTFATPKGLHEIAALLGRPLDLFGQVDRQASLPLLRN